VNKKFMKSVALSITALIFMTSSPAHAYVLPVIDFGNIVQTTITAVEQVESMAQQYLDYEEMLKANMAKLKNLDGLMKNETDLAIVASLLGYAGQLEDKLKDGKEIADTLKSWYGASNKSPEEFIRQLAKQKEAGDQRVQTLMDHYQANGAAIQEANKSLQTVGESIKDINGPTEGLQAVASSIAILVRQNNSMLSMMQMDTLQKAEDQAKKNGSIEDDKKKTGEYDKRKAALELYLKK
jgi:conjugal transfer/entry exclusion protein